MILLFNRHDPSGLGSLASVPTPERAAGAKPDRLQLLQQAVEHPEAQPVEQAVQQPVQQPEEHTGWRKAIQRPACVS